MSDSRIYFQSPPILPVENTGLKNTNPVSRNTVTTGASFTDILSRTTQQVSFSNHARQRMECRQLDISAQDLQKLNETVDKMAQKGAKESLIYMGDMAFVVSVANRTVITAMDGASAKENIFTNIDSAAIL